MNIQKVAIYSGFTNSANRATKRLKKLFVKRGFKVTEINPDLIITVGGDGTLLRYARMLGYPDTPFIGVNMGTVGFMQELEVRDVPKFITELKRSKYKIIETPLIDLKAYDDTKAESLAFNEVVIERRGSRAANLLLYINGRKFEKFIGDGLIITTPQGSTAYGAAAGGAIFPFSVKAFQVVPSNPHDSVNNRTIKSPMLMPESAKVKIKVLDFKNRPVQVTADGEEIAIDNVKQIEVGISKQRFNILRTSRFHFYQRMSDKLIGRK